MNYRIIFSLIALMFLIGCGGSTPDKNSLLTDQTESNEIDNELLGLILSKIHYRFNSKNYTVVKPIATLDDNYGDPVDLGKELNKQFNEAGYNLPELTEAFFRKNLKPVKLTLKSSQKDGYIVDNDGKFANYFKSGGDGWKKWYEENPNANGSTNISLPVKSNNGYVLVYHGNQSHWLCGEGLYILYKYRSGALTELHRIEVWIS